MPRVGEILVEMGFCGTDQISEGLQNKVIFGGRVGTNLLEIGHVTEEELAKALGQRHRVPALHGEIAIDPAVAALMQPDAVERLEVVPYKVAGRRLFLLVCDPANLPSLDEAAFVTGKSVQPI